MCKKKPKILVLLHDANLYGGTRSLLTILVGLKDKVDFLVVGQEGAVSPILAENNIPQIFYRLPWCTEPKEQLEVSGFEKIKSYLRRQRCILGAKRHLLQVVSNFKPNIIYTNTSVVSLGHWLSKRTNLPHVWHIREYGDLDHNLNYLPTRKYIENAIKQAKCSIFITEALRKHWSKEDWQLPNSRVIFNGFPIDAKLAQPKKHKPNLKFGIVGGIRPSKGQLVAAKAIATLVGKGYYITLKLFGDINDKNYFAEIEKIISEHNLSNNIVHEGFVADQDEIYGSFDVLLMCSQKEGFGRTIVEAMTRGIPVIARADGGPLEIITTSVDGLLFEDEHSLLYNMQKLLTDATLYENISTNAIQKARESFTDKQYVDKVNEIFEHIIN